MTPESIGLLTELKEVYDSKRREYMTSSSLSMFRRDPQEYHWDQLGILDRKESKAMSVGTALHALHLEGQEEFDRLCVIAPEGMMFNRKDGKDWKKSEALGLDRTIFNAKDGKAIRCMAAALQEHKVAASIFAEGIPEATVRGKYCGIQCQARPDWLRVLDCNYLGLFDLKKCANIEKFGFSVRDYAYINQMAFYASQVTAALPDYTILHHVLVAVEEPQPHRVGVFEVDMPDLDLARRKNEEALIFLQRCRDNDYWPTGFEKERWIGMKAEYARPDFTVGEEEDES